MLQQLVFAATLALVGTRDSSPPANQFRTAHLGAAAVAATSSRLLTYTVPSNEADTSASAPDPCAAGPNPEQVARTRLEVAYCGSNPTNLFVREHVVTGGQADSFLVDDSQCATYFVTVFDQAGNESCVAGITVGVPAVSVPFPGIGLERLPIYDLAGRRVRLPLRSGIYFVRPGPGKPLRIVRIK
jgi:hypothetical protein